jgi:type IV pilus assembly protein PilC
MPSYSYKAIDRHGKLCNGSGEASSFESLSEGLKTQGLFMMEVKLQMRRATDPPAPRPRISPSSKMAKSVPLAVLALFTSELSIMLRTALPMLEALHTLFRQQKHAGFKRILEDLCRNVQQGTPLSETFARSPKVFDPVYIALLRSGEATGNVPAMLERLSAYLNFQRELRTKIQSALLYPAIIILTGAGVALFLTLFILPTFAEMFKQLNTELPFPTRMLLALSHHLRMRWWGYVLAGGALAWGVRRWVADPTHARTLERAVLRLPVLGVLIRNLVMTRILRTLGALIAGGVPILEALRLAGEAASHKVFHDILERVRQCASEGKGLATALTNDPFFPAAAANMIGNAELTGTLPEVMNQISEYYERETDVAIRNVFTILEPVLVLFIGLIVGVIAVSILWPMLRLDGGL